MAIWYILWLLDICCDYLVYFPRFGMLYQEKSGNLGLTGDYVDNEDKINFGPTVLLHNTDLLMAAWCSGQRLRI
jgi:hypothetical protein